MSKEIKTNFYKHLPLEITQSKAQQIANIVYQYEMRDEHPMALGSPLLGVYEFYFLEEDMKVMFEIFGYDMEQVKEIIKHIKTIRKEFKVISHPFNLFMVYLIHKAINSKLPRSTAEHIALLLHVYLQYRFFTSVVNHFFPYKANEKYMQATIESLNKKYDIVVLGNWKNVIYERAKYFLDPKDSIHYNPIKNFEPDNRVLYVLSDLQTRIRNQIKNIAKIYYDLKEKGIAIDTTSPYTEVDGEKLIRDPEAMYDKMTTYILSNIQNNVINTTYIEAVCKFFKAVTPSILKIVLSYINMLYIEQLKEGKETEIKQQGNLTIYIGIKILIEKIIETSYEYCLKQNINITNKYKVLMAVKGLYGSSRLQNPKYLSVKQSVLEVVKQSKATRRAATLSSLYNAVILYYLLMSFEVLNK